jgi:AAA+ superfamily predicted ATPase
VAKHAEEAARYLAEGEAELDRMLGMAEAKRQVRLIRSTTKVNQARAKMGLPVSVTTRHTLLVGPPGCGKTTVARALTKQLCGLGVLRRPSVIETNKSRLVGKHLGRPRTAPASCSNPLWEVRFSSTRCTTCTTRGIPRVTRTARR